MCYRFYSKETAELKLFADPFEDYYIHFESDRNVFTEYNLICK